MTLTVYGAISRFLDQIGKMNIESVLVREWNETRTLPLRMTITTSNPDDPVYEWRAMSNGHIDAYWTPLED